MGILDKLKGHKKDESVKSFDDVAERKGKRSSSVTRKSTDKSRVASGRNEPMPNLPGSNTGVVGGTGVGAGAGSEAVATYPVEGTTGVSSHAGQTSASSGLHNTSQSHNGQTGVSSGVHNTTHSHATASDNLSTAAVKDGKVGESNVDGLSRDMAQTNLHSNIADSSSNTASYDSKNLTTKPFDRNAFHASFGANRDTTTYESVTKPAVIQETVKPHVREEVHSIFHREHHVIHHQTRIQPILEQVMLPAKHYVLIDGQKHEIMPDAVMNHVVKARDWIPMSGHKPQVIVHQYVDNAPLVGPVTGVGASLINRDVMLEHQAMINRAYESRDANIPAGQITRVNYMPGQVPVSTQPGVGASTLATSSMVGTSNGTTGQISGLSGQAYNDNHGVDVGKHTHTLNTSASTTSPTGHSAASPSSPTGRSTGSHVPLTSAIERTSERLPEQRAALH